MTDVASFPVAGKEANKSVPPRLRYGLFDDVRFTGALMRRYWTSSRWPAAWALTMLLALALVGSIFATRLLILGQASVAGGLASRHPAAFYHGVLLNLGGLVLTMGGIALNSYACQLIEIRWRARLTGDYLDRWLSDRRYHSIEMGGAIENLEQRVQEDTMLAARTTLSLLSSLAQAIGTILVLGTVLWSGSDTVPFALGALVIAIPHMMFWTAIVYALVTSVLIHFVGRSLSRFTIRQQRYEAEFRLGLVRVRDAAEQIAFYRGEADERRRLDAQFALVRGNWGSLIVRSFRQAIIQNILAWCGQMLPFFIGAGAYFQGRMTFGRLTELNATFGIFALQITWFVQSYAQIADWRANIERLRQLEAVLAAPRISGISYRSGGGALLARDLELRLPDGAPLLRLASMDVARGDRLLVKGQSGIGKSMLMRALAGLWPFGSGTIVWPSGSAMFLPQKTYVPSGSLEAALAYPAPAGAYRDEELVRVLCAVRLPHLATQLRDDQDWDRILSPGEQQRLSAARALLSRPDFLFLDEATSALDPELERELYTTLIEWLPDTAIVSVAHRPALAMFHNRVLDLSLSATPHAGAVPVPA
ncbi:MAG: ABC transporter ATP-binding protein/permease [Sphingomonas sp.]|nr:ABC transporter ATP-binding protein/permease [Sphingomonas sp.]